MKTKKRTESNRTKVYIPGNDDDGDEDYDDAR